jgi:nitrogenase molybdenum-iron protein alpha/beta subunit
MNPLYSQKANGNEKVDTSPYPRISQVSAGTVIPKQKAACFPGGQCPLFGAMTIAPQIKDAKVLVIGAAVCTYNVKLSIGMRSLTSVPLDDCFMVLPLCQDDAIFGIAQKVQDAILEINELHRPEVLFILSTWPRQKGLSISSPKRINLKLPTIGSMTFL